MNSMKKYFEDYGETWKVCNKFNKEHWLGNIILGTAIVGVELGVFHVINHKDDIKDWIDEKRNAMKKKKEMD